jgi:two-component system sensor histidine kinase KdpD
VIDEESDRLNRFIEGLSTTDRAEPSQPLHLRAVRPEAIARAGLLRAETLTRDHRVVALIDDGLPDVSVDAAAMTEVIYILLDNASKYAPAGTTITLRAVLDGDRNVRFSVSDEGPGIPPDLVERVFEKFFQVPVRESHDRRRGGVGLGLPIARRLVEAQAGRIWIEPPASSRGTTVTMSVPVSMEVPETELTTPEVVTVP